MITFSILVLPTLIAAKLVKFHAYDPRESSNGSKPYEHSKEALLNAHFDVELVYYHVEGISWGLNLKF